jgi:hypothetical protein
MSQPMASSFGEALLLLNKWHSESTPLIMLQTFMCAPARGSALMSGVLSRTTGGIAFIEEGTGTFTFVSSNKDFIVVSPTGCEYGYNANFQLPPNLARFVPKDLESMLSVLFPNDTRLMIFAA